MATTTIYLTLEPTWRRGQLDKLHSVQVAKMTKNRPDHPTGPVVKLTLNVPDSAFIPIRADVTLDVPEGAIDTTGMVTVEQPDVPVRTEEGL